MCTVYSIVHGFLPPLSWRSFSSSRNPVSPWILQDGKIIPNSQTVFYSLWLANCKMSGAHLKPSFDCQIVQWTCWKQLEKPSLSLTMSDIRRHEPALNHVIHVISTSDLLKAKSLGAAQKKSKSKRSIENGSTQFLQPGGLKPEPSCPAPWKPKCQTFQCNLSTSKQKISK